MFFALSGVDSTCKRRGGGTPPYGILWGCQLRVTKKHTTCHCEERSDVAISRSCLREQEISANSEDVQEIATSGCTLLTMEKEHFYPTQTGNCMQPRISQGTKAFLAAESMSLMRLSWLTSLAPGS